MLRVIFENPSRKQKEESPATSAAKGWLIGGKTIWPKWQK